MNYALITDIHGNKPALTSVISEIRQEGIGEHNTICLGDIIGYGPWPHECLEIVQNECLGGVLAGNHEMAACHSEHPFRYVGSRHTKTREWTRNQLTIEDLQYLNTLRDMQVFDWFVAAHAKPGPPGRWFHEKRVCEYVQCRDTEGPTSAMQDVFDYLSELRQLLPPVHGAFFGHSHEAWALRDGGGIVRCKGEDVVPCTVRHEGRLLIGCVPSTGMARDGDWRSGWMETHPDGVTLHRTEYDAAATIKAIRDIIEIPADYKVAPLPEGAFPCDTEDD